MKCKIPSVDRMLMILLRSAWGDPFEEFACGSFKRVSKVHSCFRLWIYREFFSFLGGLS